MAFYTMECGCGCMAEYEMSPSGPLTCGCQQCGAELDVRRNRVWQIDGPSMSFSGLPTTGAVFDGYYDESLETYVKSKQHRQDVMDRRGLSEFEPDPEMKRHRDEAKYIKSQAPKGDPGAAAAARREHKTASEKRTKRNTEAALKKEFDKAGI